MASGEDKGPAVVGVSILFEVIAFIAVILRFWSQRVKRRKTAAHDILIVAAFIGVTALAVCLILSVTQGGLGKHAEQLAATPEKLVLFEKLIVGLQVCWAFAITCTRLSMLALYVELFSEAATFRKVCYSAMLLCVLWGIGEILLAFLICRPLAYNWDPSIDGVCGNTTAAYIGVHTSNFFVDLVLALLPIRVLWSLKMATHRKVGIMLLFALGALICAISIARVALYKGVVDYGEADFTYTSTTLYLFTAMEPALGTTLACMPLLRPLSEKMFATGPMTYLVSLMRTSRTRTTRRSAGRDDGYLETGSVEGLRSEAHANGGWKTSQERQQWDKMQGIYVNHGFEQRTYEMKRV